MEPRRHTPSPPRRRGRGAFTLLELIVVIVVLGVLALLALPTFGGVIERAVESTEVAQAEAIAREALALAAFDGLDLPTDDHVLAALADLAAAETAGVSAASLVGGYVFYPQAEWQWLDTYPDHPGRRIAVYGTFDGAAGFATMSVNAPARCVMVRFNAGGVTSHTREVTDPLDCHADRAIVEAPTAAPVPEPNPGGARHIGLNMMDLTGSFDSVVVRVGADVVAADDFNRGPGPLDAAGGIPWTAVGELIEGFELPSPRLTGATVTGSVAEAPNIAFAEVPDARTRIDATIGALPVEHPMQLQTVDLSQFAANHLLNVDPDGSLTLVGRVPGCENNDAFRPTAPLASVRAGDTISLIRVDDNVARAAVNGVVFASLDRATLSPATHGCDAG